MRITTTVEFTLEQRVEGFPLEPEPVGEEAVERTDGRTSRTGRMAGWMMRAGSGRVTLHRNTSMTLWFPATSTSAPPQSTQHASTRPNFPLIPICFTYANLKRSNPCFYYNDSKYFIHNPLCVHLLTYQHT